MLLARQRHQWRPARAEQLYSQGQIGQTAVSDKVGVVWGRQRGLASCRGQDSCPDDDAAGRTLSAGVLAADCTRVGTPVAECGSRQQLQGAH
jgi:hypothetical protein